MNKKYVWKYYLDDEGGGERVCDLYVKFLLFDWYNIFVFKRIVSKKIYVFVYAIFI